MSKTLVKTVPIPESIANDLTHNLTAYKVNMDAYIQVLDSDTAVKILDKLCEINQRIDTLKNMITNKWIPSEYQFDRFQWEFNGTHIDGPNINIYDVTNSPLELEDDTK